MLQSHVCSNIESDSFKSGEHIGKSIKSKLTKISIIFIYISETHEHTQLVKGVKSVLGDVNIIGNTSSCGVITPSGYLFNREGFACALAIYDAQLEVRTSLVSNTSVQSDSLEAYTLGLKLGHSLNQGLVVSEQPPTFLYMVSSPGEEESYLEGISQKTGRLPLFGGSAADNSVQGSWALFTQSESTRNGAAAALFLSNKKIVNQYADGYHESINMGLVTKMKGKRVVCEINNQPALKQYAEWIGETVESLRGDQLLTKSILKPIGIKDITGSLTAIRHPLVGYDDMSMSVGNDICEGSSFIQMSATKAELIGAVRHTIRELFAKMPKEKVGALHLVHCAGRRMEIGNEIHQVHEILQEECGDIPYVVEFTFGEYGYNECSANTCGGLMLSFTAFEK
ncbi:FIST N-terminal domain-containing protein [Vibrio parahaemolyticus]|nr:FIST N-terminal domain-containing protein [Vibrio parahaemolyticus]